LLEREINVFHRAADFRDPPPAPSSPVALVADAILDCSKRGSIVLDAFAGSGTTLVAAARTGRRGYGIELDPKYCDVVLRRFAAADIDAVHAETGRVFRELTAEQVRVDERTSNIAVAHGEERPS
jgi:DNA modification methylase